MINSSLLSTLLIVTSLGNTSKLYDPLLFNKVDALFIIDFSILFVI